MNKLESLKFIGKGANREVYKVETGTSICCVSKKVNMLCKDHLLFKEEVIRYQFVQMLSFT